MKSHPWLPAFLSLLIALSFIHCTLDEGNPGNAEPALSLQIHPELSLITLEWPRVKVTGFKEYVLLQSSEDIPNAPEPTVNQDVTVLTRINDVNVTSFSTTNTLLSPKSCFKLYCSVEDRFLYSGTVCINQPPNVLPGFFDRADHADGIAEIAMFDRLKSQVVAYSDETGTITNSITETLLSFPQLDLSTYQGAHRLFAFDLATTAIRKYTFPQLAFQNQKLFSESVFGGLAWNNFVFVLFQNATNGFQILNAANLSAIDTGPGLTGNRNLAVFEGDPLIVLEIGDASIKRYQVNTSGKVIQSDQFLTGINQPNTQNTSDFNDAYFIGGRLATIVNPEAEIITSLETGVNVFAQFCRLSPDGSKVVILLSDLNTFSLEVFDITELPAFTKLKTYSLPAVSYSDVYIRGDIIHVLGVNFNSSSPQTFFLKFPM